MGLGIFLARIFSQPNLVVAVIMWYKCTSKVPDIMDIPQVLHVLFPKIVSPPSPVECIHKLSCLPSNKAFHMFHGILIYAWRSTCVDLRYAFHFSWVWWHRCLLYGPRPGYGGSVAGQWSCGTKLWSPLQPVRQPDCAKWDRGTETEISAKGMIVIPSSFLSPRYSKC